MESTGKYYVPIYNLLEDTIRVTVANPKWISAVKGNKDDIKDSKWIGGLFRLGLVPGSFIPEKRVRILRECTRYRYKLVSCKSSEKNRFQNAFTVYNIALDSVVSNMFGKSASSIADYLVNGDSFDPEHCASLLQRSLKKKADAVIQSIEGFQMTEEQKMRIRFVREHYDFLDALIVKLDQTIASLSTPFGGAVALLCTIPGVDRNTAFTVISEIGTDLTQFSSSKQLCSWAGLTPSNNQSASKKKSVRISRAGVYPKPALVQADRATVKYKDSAYYRIKFERTAKRRGKKRAVVAISRMLLTAVFYMLQTSEVFNPSDLLQVDMPQELRNKQREKAIRKAIKLLVAQDIILPENIAFPA